MPQPSDHLCVPSIERVGDKWTGNRQLPEGVGIPQITFESGVSRPGNRPQYKKDIIRVRRLYTYSGMSERQGESRGWSGAMVMVLIAVEKVFIYKNLIGPQTWAGLCRLDVSNAGCLATLGI